MVNLKLIGTIAASAVAVCGLGYYFWATRKQPGLLYGTKEEHLKIPDSVMTEMKKHFKRDGGMIKYPGSWNYAQYSTPFNGKCKDRPCVVFIPGSYENVKEAITIFKTYNQKFTIMGGGHDFEAICVGKVALLNLGLLKKVNADFKEETLIVQAGARWRDVYPIIFDTGYELMGGQCPMVGVAGFLLGAGFNWKLSPLYGSGAEHVIEMKAVLENGEIVTLTRDNEYKDLMWGMLGAGGMNFGVALEFKIKLLPYPKKKYKWMLMTSKFSQNDDQYPGIDAMVETMKSWIKFFGERRPKDGFGGNTVFYIRDRKNIYTMGVHGVSYDCDWEEQIKEICKSHPLQNTHYMNKEWTWGQFETLFPEGVEKTRSWISNPGLFLSDLNDEIAENMLRGFIDENLEIQRLQITTFEGSIRDPDRTSFPFPEAKWKLACLINVRDHTGKEWQKKQIATWKEVIRRSAGDKYLGEYINYVDFNTEDYQKDYFGRNFKKLQEIKDKYDPGYLFKRPFGIPPSK